MNDDSARAVTLLQAFETAQPASPNWSVDDGAWATRLALHDLAAAPPAIGIATGAATGTASGVATRTATRATTRAATLAAADTEAFVVRRAQHALQRLGPREPGAAAWLTRRLWRNRWVGWALLIGVGAGLLADSIGSSQRINLLAPPLWAVLAWNAVVYLLLLGHALTRLLRPGRRQAAPGTLVRAVQRLLRWSGPPAGRGGASATGGSGAALQAFATLWLRLSAPLTAARGTALLHAAAAGLAAGLVAGLYLRGLVLDYRAAWESTFLSADAARALLGGLLAPAAALSGIALPDAAAFEAMRTAHGGAGTAAATGASAAPWIHLLALTLLGFVGLPRAVLALGSGLRAQWLARHMPLPLTDAYFQRLARQQRGDLPRVVVIPYAGAPDAQAALGLQALLAAALGAGLRLHIAPTAAYGAEDAVAPAALDPATTLAIALFDLAATPEAENQGRFVRQLAARAPAGAATIVVVDEAAFKRRFAGDAPRLAQRRDAWRGFGEALGTRVVCVDLGAPDLPTGALDLQRAMQAPIGPSAP